MPISILFNINYKFPMNNPKEIIEGHCFGEGFNEGFVAKDIIKKTSKLWQMSFTHMYEYTCNGK